MLFSWGIVYVCHWIFGFCINHVWWCVRGILCLVPSQRNILDYCFIFLDMGILKKLKETTEKAVDKGAELSKKGIEKGAEVGTKAYDSAKEAAEKGRHKAREGKTDQK